MKIIGIDTGGTFTDFIYHDGTNWKVYKCLSTPKNPAKAVLDGLKQMTDGEKIQIVHGSTVATNAILEMKGARTALVTNKGFEDVIEIGRQNRTELYSFFYQKDPPLIPAELRFGIRCRVNNKGGVLEDPDDTELLKLVDQLKAANVESVAVCFLFSFLNPVHENRVSKALAELDLPVSLSHDILSEFREYERTSTTAINAYVTPKMNTYIEDLSKEIGPENLQIMQSNGGSITSDTAERQPVRTILSGPAGGVVGALEVAKQAGYNKLITFDMGGTSTDVSLIDGRLPLTMEASVGKYPVKVPMIDIHTVGAGGGSIAAIDAGGAMKVGPESAGADPGPVCYGKGEAITVTDANLYLGRLVPEHFLGGRMRLDMERVEFYIKKLSKQTGLTRIEAAQGVLAVANTAMERAIRVISVERGFNPAEFTLFSFGGAGGMHALFLAKLLNIPKVLIPRHPGILSAMGMLLADVVKDYSKTVMINHTQADTGYLSNLFMPLEKKAQKELKAEGIQKEKMTTESFLDMRYLGQSYEITVPFGDQVADTFHKMHEKRYGYARPDKEVEIVNIRMRAKGKKMKPGFEKIEPASETSWDIAVLGEKDVIFEGKKTRTQVIARDRLGYGHTIKGPAIIVEYSSTLVIPPFACANIDEYGNCVASMGIK